MGVTDLPIHRFCFEKFHCRAGSRSCRIYIYCSFFLIIHTIFLPIGLVPGLNLFSCSLLNVFNLLLVLAHVQTRPLIKVDHSFRNIIYLVFQKDLDTCFILWWDRKWIMGLAHLFIWFFFVRVHKLFSIQFCKLTVLSEQLVKLF
jgi:hypothetical protein